eukprot:11213663-Lingulodinium_polyedra.AAC.1
MAMLKRAEHAFFHAPDILPDMAAAATVQLHSNTAHGLDGITNELPKGWTCAEYYLTAVLLTARKKNLRSRGS